MSTLLFLDTRGIKKYVDKRTYLYELRASSRKLKKAMEATAKEIVQNFPGTNRIFVGGGNAFFKSDHVFSNSDFDKIRSWFFRCLDLPATSVSPSLSIQAGVNQNLNAIRTELSKRKREFHDLSPSALPNTKEACSSCMEYKGTDMVIYDGEEDDKILCEYCMSLRKHGKEMYHKMLKEQIHKNKIDVNLGDLLNFQLEFIAGNSPGESGAEKKRLSVVMIDGNLFGEFFSTIEKGSELGKISEQIDKEMNRIFDDELAIIEKRDKLDGLRMRMGKIYIGGDDMKLIMPARIAIPFAYNVLSKFTEWSKKSLGKELHLSAGIFVTKPKIKLDSMFEMSNFLLKQAKEIHHSSKGSIDFHLSHSQLLPRTLSTYRKQRGREGVYTQGVNIGDRLWSLLINRIPEISSYDGDIGKEIKSKYLQPWRRVNQKLIDTKSIAETLLYTSYMFKRHMGMNHPTVNGYRIALELLSIGEMNYLERAIELIKVRFEL